MLTATATTKPTPGLRFSIAGRVTEEESGLGVPDLLIQAYDKDLLFDDFLGSATTGEDGRFEIRYSEAEFRELFDREPDIYLSVYAPPRRLLMRTAAAIRWNASEPEDYKLVIARDTLGPVSPVIRGAGATTKVKSRETAIGGP